MAAAGSTPASRGASDPRLTGHPSPPAVSPISLTAGGGSRGRGSQLFEPLARERSRSRDAPAQRSDSEATEPSSSP
eukprot:259294-Heterocapsa_arctica.AAC.1